MAFWLGSETETLETNVDPLRNKTITFDNSFGASHKTFLRIGASSKMTVKKWAQP